MLNSLAELNWRIRLSYTCFALALLMAHGSLQFVSPVRQAIFFDVVGTDLEPLAKTLVMLVLVPVLLSYNLLFTVLQHPRVLVLCVGGFFAAVYLFVAVSLHWSAGHPGMWLAWLLYYATECRAVVLMPMIWSILNDITPPTAAPTLFPPIFCAVQLGGVGGSLIAVHAKGLGGEVGLLLIQTGALLAIVLLTWCGCGLNQQLTEGNMHECNPLIKHGQFEERGQWPTSRKLDEVVHTAKLKGNGGFAYKALEGLWLLLSRPYVFMTFWVSYAALMPRTILDYTSGVLVRSAYPARAEQVAFWGHMSLVQNGLVALLTLLGTRLMVHALGVGRALLVLPLTMLCCTLAVSLQHSNLWVSVVACTTASVIAYGLNSPCKEMLYIHTSREIKYKAKSWAEMYGNEVMKLAGAQINLWVNQERTRCLPRCFHSGTTLLIVVVWVGLWLNMAVKVGREHERLIKADQTVK